MFESEEGIGDEEVKTRRDLYQSQRRVAVLIVINSNGDTAEFYFSKVPNLSAAKRFIRKALTRHTRPERITTDGIETGGIVIVQCDTESRHRARRFQTHSHDAQTARRLRRCNCPLY